MERADVDAAGVEEQRGERLAEQFGQRAQPPAVVYQSHEGNTCSADEDAPELGEVVTFSQDKRRDDNSQIDGHAPHTGNGTVVDFARCGPVHHADPRCQPARHRGNPNSQHQCASEDQHINGHGCDVSNDWIWAIKSCSTARWSSGASCRALLACTSACSCWPI